MLNVLNILRNKQINHINLNVNVIMLNSCSAINCTNRANKHTSLKFHSFPQENKVFLKKWIVTTKRDKFKPDMQ